MTSSHATKSVSAPAFAAIVFTALVLIYLPHLPSDFIGDDIGRIGFWKGQIDLAGLLDGLGDRPFLALSLWFDQNVLRLGPLGMRVENLGWVTAVAVTLRHLSAQASSHFKVPTNPWWRDAVILICAIHPLHIQMVGHVVQRGILLGFELSLLATVFLWQYFINRERPKLLLAILCWIVALLFKPNIIFMPILWLTLQRQLAPDLKTRWITPFVALALIPLVLYVAIGYNTQTTAPSSWKYFLVQGELLPIYVRLMLLPIGLHFNYDFSHVVVPDPVLGLSVWVGLVCIAAFAVREARPRISGVFFFGGLCAFIPESSFFGIIHPFFEHRASVPLLFFGLALSVLPINLTRLRVLALGAAVLLLASLGVNRTLRLQSFSAWAVPELQSTCYLTYFFTYTASVLVERKEFRALDEVLGSPGCETIKASRTYLARLSRAVREQNPAPADILALNRYLHSGSKFEATLIKLADDILMARFPPNRSGRVTCAVEDLFSNQLRRFRDDPVDNHERIGYYLEVAQACLAQLRALKQRTVNEDLQGLKIRAVLRVYFGKPDPHLERDLNRNSEDSRFQRLRDFIGQRH